MGPTTAGQVERLAGNLLRIARARAGMSQRDLAEIAHVPQSDPRQPKTALPRCHQKRPLATSSSRGAQPAPVDRPRLGLRRNRMGANIDRSQPVNLPHKPTHASQPQHHWMDSYPSKPLAKLPAHQPQPMLAAALFRAFLGKVEEYMRAYPPPEPGIPASADLFS
jgi:hypothetical protein